MKSPGMSWTVRSAKLRYREGRGGEIESKAFEASVCHCHERANHSSYLYNLLQRVEEACVLGRQFTMGVQLTGFVGAH